MLKTHDFYYDLPEELIAQTPLERRDASRLMTLDRKTGEVTHRHFYDLVDLLQPGDCLVMNNSRVLPARLLGHREPTGGAVEVLLLKDQGSGVWECLTKPGRKTHTGTELSFGGGELTATVVGEKEDGNKLVQFHYEGIFLEVLERLGKMPLPPYIKEELEDGERYQTVYSKVNGSAARRQPVCILPASCWTSLQPRASKRPISRCTSVSGPSGPSRRRRSPSIICTPSSA